MSDSADDDAGASTGAGTDVVLSGSVTVDDDLQEALTSALQRERMLAPPVLGAALASALVAAVAVALTQGSVAIGVVGALVVIGILVLLMRASTRTRVLRGYAVGTTIGVGLDALARGRLRLDTGALVEVLDLSLFAGVSVRGEVVLLRLRGGGTSLLPRSLVDDDALRRLRDAVSSAATSAGSEPEPEPELEPPSASVPLPWTHTITATDNRVRRTRLLRVVRQVRRQTYVLVLVVAVAFAGLTRSPWPLAIVVVIAAQDLLDRRWVARSDGLVFAAGTPVRAGILDDRLVVATPRAVLSRPLDLLLEVSDDDGLVVLGWDLPSRETQYPAALIPPDAVAALRGSVAGRDHGSRPSREGPI